MSDTLIRDCSELDPVIFRPQVVAEQAWESLLMADCFIEGNFTFASGLPATLKADAERLYNHQQPLDTMLGLYATYPCVVDADILLYVPYGPADFAEMLGRMLSKPVAHARRTPNATSKYDFEFTTPEAEALATEAKRPLIIEDIVSTLGSVAALRALLPKGVDVHSLAMLLRGEVNPEYREGLHDHYLIERQIPTDKEEFKRLLRLDSW